MAQWPVLGSALPGGMNRVTIPPGGTYLLGPGAGVYSTRTNSYISVQQRDPVSGTWAKIGGGTNTGGVQTIYSDGVNYRLANQTGAPAGALLTNAGSGYTSPPTVTASAGGSIWRAIVGGAVSTTVTITNAGLNYVYPPIVVIDSPGPGGVQATGYCALSGGTVTSVTIDNQGAGYTQPPQVTFVNDPREINNQNLSDGYGAAASLALTGAQTVTSVLCLDHGQGGLTSLPTLAFSGGGGSSAAATVIMCWSITAYAVTTGGTGWTTPPLISAYDNFPTTSAAYANPQTGGKGVVATNPASIIGAVSAGAITATGQIVSNGGIYTSVPTIVMQTSGILITASAALTATMGGQNGTAYIQTM
jgi:hypothetical protein